MIIYQIAQKGQPTSRPPRLTINFRRLLRKVAIPVADLPVAPEVQAPVSLPPEVAPVIVRPADIVAHLPLLLPIEPTPPPKLSWWRRFLRWLTGFRGII